MAAKYHQNLRVKFPWQPIVTADSLHQNDENLATAVMTCTSVTYPWRPQFDIVDYASPMQATSPQSSEECERIPPDLVKARKIATETHGTVSL